MSVAAVETFYEILAVFGVIGLAVLVLLRLTALVSNGGRDTWSSAVEALGPHAYALAWFVALLATVGSLYFSEVAGFEPCRLCWYQGSPCIR